jgi:Histidine kinase-, DNA gyrase B-, and HSP90-like ATPase
MHAPHAPLKAAGRHTQARLKRETFQTSRLLDFCSERELTKQIGHGVDHWPLVILKELTDNALDAAEEAGTAPVIGVEVTDGAIIITDNGPGIPAEIIAGILDFSVRVSSREAYASPTRGAQGNALKTIIAMAFTLDGAKGETLIESRGTAHRITFKVNHIRHEPHIEHIRENSTVKKADHGSLAGLCLLKTDRGQGAFFTNGRGLRLAEPAPFAFRHVESQALRRLQGFRSFLVEMAAASSDPATLVRFGAFAALDGGLYRPRSGQRS